MNNAGITRINITDKISGAGAWRFEAARRLAPVANVMYRNTFTQMGMELLPGDARIDTAGEAFAAGYDKALGVDLFLRFTSGMQATLQEKFLGTAYSTVTVEYYQNWRTKEEGDWFKLRVDYYFVGYHSGVNPYFDRWILLDWPAVQRATARNLIEWGERTNTKDGARANFRYAEFTAFPKECVIGSYFDRVTQLAGARTRPDRIHPRTSLT